MTLFDAYQLANKRRFAVEVRIAGELGHSVRVLPKLHRGSVRVRDRDSGALWTIPTVEARGLEVTR
jgi:hypothetical protein